MSLCGISEFIMICTGNNTNMNVLLCLFRSKNRVFPTRRRAEVENLLQKYRGDVVQAMEAMLSGSAGAATTATASTPPTVDDQMHPLGGVGGGPPSPAATFAAVKSAFSPLMPPGVFGAATAVGRYPFLQQQHAKRFLSAPYAGTGFLSTIIQSGDPNDPTDGAATANAVAGERCSSGAEDWFDVEDIVACTYKIHLLVQLSYLNIICKGINKRISPQKHVYDIHRERESTVNRDKDSTPSFEI